LVWWGVAWCVMQGVFVWCGQFGVVWCGVRFRVYVLYKRGRERGKVQLHMLRVEVA